MKAKKLDAKKEVRGLRVNVKLAEDSDPQRSRSMLSRLRGVRSVIQTFPDESDPELRRLFVLEIDPAELETALKELRRNREVEYAEKPPLRKLIR